MQASTLLTSMLRQSMSDAASPLGLCKGAGLRVMCHACSTHCAAVCCKPACPLLAAPGGDCCHAEAERAARSAGGWTPTSPSRAPSFELEIFFNGQWLEVLGCGCASLAPP